MNAHRRGWCQVRMQRKVPQVDLQLEEQSSSQAGLKNYSHEARAKSNSYRFRSDRVDKGVRSNQEGRQLDGKDDPDLNQGATDLSRGAWVLYVLKVLQSPTSSRDKQCETLNQLEGGKESIFHLCRTHGWLLLTQSSLSFDMRAMGFT